MCVVELVLAIAAEERVVAGFAAPQRVIAGAAVDDVVVLVADQDRVACEAACVEYNVLAVNQRHIDLRLGTVDLDGCIRLREHIRLINRLQCRQIASGAGQEVVRRLAVLGDKQAVDEPCLHVGECLCRLTNEVQERIVALDVINRPTRTFCRLIDGCAAGIGVLERDLVGAGAGVDHVTRAADECIVVRGAEHQRAAVLETVGVTDKESCTSCISAVCRTACRVRARDLRLSAVTVGDIGRHRADIACIAICGNRAA